MNVTNELKQWADEQADRYYASLEQFAADQFATHGRGAVYFRFDSIAAVRATPKQFFKTYLPVGIVEETEYTEGIRFVHGYNPARRDFVVIASVDIVAPDPDVSNAIFVATLYRQLTCGHVDRT